MRRISRALVAVTILVLSSSVVAQRPDAAAGATRPRIDPLTASITGRVTVAGGGSPVRGAEVRAMTDSGVTRLTVTDLDGRYEIRDLPAGQYRVFVSKAGFVSMQFGQRLPFEAPASIPLREGERVVANVVLIRGGAIAGRVYDERGEPVEGIRVQALRPRMVQGRRQLQPAGVSGRSDDTGAYRIYGLSPGEYYVSAVRSSGAGFQGAPPVYYPGTADFTLAQRIALGLGAQAHADVQLVSVRAARVSGIVLNAAGVPAPAMITLTSEAVGLGYRNAVSDSVPLIVRGDSAADGSFTLTDVPPGPYALHATLPGGPMEGEMASMPLVVGNDDITGLTVALGTVGAMTGAFVRDVAVAQPLPRGLGVSTRPLRAGGGTMHAQGPDGIFRLMGLRGPFYLHAEGLPDGWAVTAVIVDDEDVTDRPIDLGSRQQAVARIVITDRVTDVSGTVAARIASSGYSAIVFADDPATWGYRSRWVRAVRVDDQGRFRVQGLPPFGRYLAVAMNYLEEGEADDPQFLERLRSRATSFSLREGERRALDVPLLER